MLDVEAAPMVLGGTPPVYSFGGWAFEVETEVTGPEGFAQGNGSEPQKARVRLRSARDGR